MSEIDNYFTSDSNCQAIFNLDKFCSMLPKSKKNKLYQASIRVRSDSRSPLRQKIPVFKRSTSSNSRSTKPPQICSNKNDTHTHQSLNRIVNMNQNGEHSQNDYLFNNAYHSQKLSRHVSLTDLTQSSKSQKGKRGDYQNSGFVYFSDLSLYNSMIFYASTENKLNGILFSPRNFDFNSSLFTRMFFNFSDCCNKIRNFFDKSEFFQVSKSTKNYKLILKIDRFYHELFVNSSNFTFCILELENYWDKFKSL